MLLSIWPQLRQAALLAFAAEDVLRSGVAVGRKLHGNFQGEVSTDLKKRPEGWRIKHRLKGNSIKLYDQFSVLRIETTINNAREFKVLHSTDDTRRWVPMGKGVANFWRYYQVGQQANHRCLDALAHVAVQGEAVAELDSLCQGRTKDGRHSSLQETKRRCARVSRLIAKLRGHGLVAKVKDARLYRVTARGYRLMSAALAFRLEGFPQAAHAA